MGVRQARHHPQDVQLSPRSPRELRSPVQTTDLLAPGCAGEENTRRLRGCLNGDIAQS